MITFNSQAMTIVTVCDDRENAMRSDKIKNIRQQPHFIFIIPANIFHTHEEKEKGWGNI